jgi:hypothetical protein
LARPVQANYKTLKIDSPGGGMNNKTIHLLLEIVYDFIHRLYQLISDARIHDAFHYHSNSRTSELMRNDTSAIHSEHCGPEITCEQILARKHE